MFFLLIYILIYFLVQRDYGTEVVGEKVLFQKTSRKRRESTISLVVEITGLSLGKFLLSPKIIRTVTGILVGRGPSSKE